MTIVILHGINGFAGKHWQQWLHDELIKEGHKVIMPTLPDPEHPDRRAWQDTIEKLVKDENLTRLIIVGHSLGVPAALDVIEAISTPIFSLVSVSGFYRAYGEDLNDYYMQERKIRMDKVRRNVKHAAVFYGDNDPYVPQKELQALADELDVSPIIIPGGGHLNTSAGYETFPQLLDSIKSIINQPKNARQN